MSASSAVEHRLTQPGRHVACARRDARARGVAIAAQLLEVILEQRKLVGLGAEERVRARRRGVDAFETVRADLGDVSGDREAELLAQVLARDRARRDRRDRDARRGAAAAAVVADAVFLLIRVVAVAGPEAVLDLLVVTRASIHVVDEESDGSAGRPAFEHPERMRTWSGSWRWLVCFDVPVRRGSRSAWMSASDSASPGGQPSTMAPIAGPWLSPKVVTQNDRPIVFPDMASVRQVRGAQNEYFGESPLELEPGQRQFAEATANAGGGIADFDDEDTAGTQVPLRARHDPFDDCEARAGRAKADRRFCAMLARQPAHLGADT